MLRQVCQSNEALTMKHLPLNTGYLRYASVLALVGVAGWLCFQRSRNTFNASEANACVSNLRRIDIAKVLAGRDLNLKKGDKVPERCLIDYKGWPLKCPSGGTYKVNPYGEFPECSILRHRIPH
jgi:hypothetical protein